MQLGGAPNFSPDGLMTRSHSEYIEGVTLLDMIKEDLVAERIAIDSYREMVSYFGNEDPTTRRLMEGILAMEEEHADDLVSLLEELGSLRVAPRDRPPADSPSACWALAACRTGRRYVLTPVLAPSPTLEPTASSVRCHIARPRGACQ